MGRGRRDRGLVEDREYHEIRHRKESQFPPDGKKGERPSAFSSGRNTRASTEDNHTKTIDGGRRADERATKGVKQKLGTSSKTRGNSRLENTQFFIGGGWDLTRTTRGWNTRKMCSVSTTSDCNECKVKN